MHYIARLIELKGMDLADLPYVCDEVILSHIVFLIFHCNKMLHIIKGETL